MDLQIKKFGKFKLLQKIARGGMAEIFLACTGSIESAHKFVVIKRISLMHSHSKEFNKMFQNEGKIAINLNHSNIGSIYEFGIEKDQYFICMEYISGRNIRQLVKKLKSQKKSLSVEFGAHIIKYACNGLDYAHNCTDNQTGQPLNIIHRDVSPQNIMVSFGGDIKVIDFGIAKIDDSEATKAGVLKGKFEYMSPEQARGKDIDKQTDIFSLGNVLWELLAGRKLFTGSNEIQLLKKIRDCQIPDIRKINPQVPDKLAEIVSKALNANKHLRYKTVADMGNDISIFLNKHFPNFTHSDFSSFIKEAYTEEILEERQNLKAYSQALKKSMPGHVKSASTSPETYSSKFKGYTKELEEKSQVDDEYTGAYSEFSDSGTAEDKEFENKYSKWTETATRPTMTGQRTELTKTKFDDPLDSKTKPSPLEESYKLSSSAINRNTITTNTGKNSEKSTAEYSPWYSPNKDKALIDRQRVLRGQKRKKRVFQRTFIISVLGGALSSAYFFSPEVKSHVLNWTQHFKVMAGKKATAQPTLKENQPEITGEEGEVYGQKREITATPTQDQNEAPSSPPLVKEPLTTRDVFLVTKPSGARVFVNGERADDITPTSISVHSHKKNQILIQKTGYQDMKVTLSPKDIKNKMRYSLNKKAGGRKSETIIIR